MIRNKYKTMNIPVKTVIPNMITCGSIFCGTASLIMTLHANFIPAAILIFFAVFFDIMDGRVARSLGGSSAFGEELDSLADAISFGLAPALLMYSVYIDAAGGILGILAAAFFALCGVLRLARFNVSHVPAGPFQGLAYTSRRAYSGGICYRKVSSRACSCYAGHGVHRGSDGKFSAVLQCKKT
jgi:CDP-diacylglycerol--serine O-phosphatidyltransferase